MKRHVEALLSEALAAAIAVGDVPAVAAGHVGAIDEPRDPSWGDLACDLPMVVAATLRRPAIEVAEAIHRHLNDPRGWLASAEVGGPGFLNLRLAPAFWHDVLAEAAAPGGGYGRSVAGRGRRVRVPRDDAVAPDVAAEQWRTALIADASARMLEAAGYQVERVSGRGGRYLPCPGPVTLVLRAGRPLRGVTVARLLDAVTPATARLLLLAERVGRPVEIDVELARREHVENPAFYVRYALERCRRTMRRARVGEAEIGREPLDAAAIDTLRLLGSYPDVVERAAAAWEPHRLVMLAIELAAAFHRYYNRDRVLAEGRALTPMRFAMARGVCQVLDGTLRLVGVTVSEDE
jgi:arginyl-tRNA synthetase